MIYLIKTHYIFLFLIIAGCNLIELTDNKFGLSQWWLPSFAGFCIWIIIESLFWIGWAIYYLLL